MNRTTLTKATSSEDSPTPGYLYGEVAKMTQEGQDVTQKVVKFLMDRLKRKEPVVKHKVLLMIKHVCRRGDPSFRRTIQSTGAVSEVKSCLQFTGPADPLKGDQPYRVVREAAKDALEAIFDNSTEVTSSNSALAQRIQGYGANPAPGIAPDASSHYDDAARNYHSPQVDAARYGGAGSSSSSMGGYSGMSSSASGNRYHGIGNPNFKDPRNQPKGFMDRVKDRIDEYSDKAAKSAATAGIQQWLGSDKKRNAPSRHDSGSYAGPGSSYASNQGSYAGPGTGNSSMLSSGPSTFGQSGPWGNSGGADPRSPRQVNSSYAASSSAASPSTTVSDGRYERSLVDELCSRGGVRPVPSREKLTAFLSACKTLDAQVVMPILYEKLSSGEWKSQHKALCVCEALIQAEDLEAFVDYLDEHAEILEDLRQSSQPMVRTRTQKVWALLYGEEVDSNNETLQQQQQSSSSTSYTNASNDQDLLNFDSPKQDLYEAPVPTEESEPVPTPVAAGGGSMFGNLQMKASAPAAPAQSNSSSNDSDLLYGDDDSAPQNSGNSSSGAIDLESLLGGGNGASAKAEHLASQLQALSIASNTSTSTSGGEGSTGFDFIGGGGPSSTVANSQHTNGMGNDLMSLSMPSTSSSSSSVPVVRASSSSSDQVGSAFDNLMAPNASTSSTTTYAPAQNVNVPSMPQMNPQQIQQNAQFQQFQQFLQMQQQLGMNMPPPQQQQQLFAMMMQQQQQQQHPQGQAQFPMSQQQMMPQQTQNGYMGMNQNGVTKAHQYNGPGSSSSTQQSKPAQPDKFDFVSSAMAQMK